MCGALFVELGDDEAVDGSDRVGVDLEEASIVGEQAIDFTFDIGGLGIDSGGEATADEVGKGACIPSVFGGNLVGGGELDISPVAVLPPEVSLDRQAYTAVFAEHIDALRVVEIHSGGGVVVEVEYIAAASEVATAGTVDEA